MASPAPNIGDRCVDSAHDMLTADLGDHLATRFLAKSRRRTARPGEILVGIGEPRHAGLLLCGLLSAAAPVVSGQAPTLYYIDAGEFFGLSTLFLPSSVSVHAMKLSTVIELDVPTVVEVAEEWPRVASFVAGRLARDASRLPAIADDFGFKTVRERIAGHLVRIADVETVGGEPVARVTHEVLAELAGTAREVVTRCLRSLRDEGIIRMAPRAVHILDEAALLRVRDSTG